MATTDSYRDPVERSSPYVVYQVVFISLYYVIVLAIARVLYRSYSRGRPRRSTRWQLGFLLAITAAARGTSFFFLPLVVAELLRTLKDIVLVSIFAALIAYWAQVCHFVYDRALIVTRYRRELVIGTSVVALVRLAQGVVHVVNRNLVIRDVLGGVYAVALASLFAIGLFFGSSLLQRLRGHARSQSKRSLAYARALRITTFLIGMSVIAFAVLITWTLRYTVFFSARCKDDGSNAGSCDPQLWFWLKFVEKVGEMVACLLLFIIIQPTKKSRHARSSAAPFRGAHNSTAAASDRGALSASPLRDSDKQQPMGRAGTPDYAGSTDDSADGTADNGAPDVSISPMHMTSNPLSSIQEAGNPGEVRGP